MTFPEQWPITETTELYYDLGLSGEDLADAVERIGTLYGTDFSSMDLRRYSPAEGYDPGFNIVRVFNEWRGKRTYSSLTVACLIDGIQAGSWSQR
jgi:hypothetical protein